MTGIRGQRRQVQCHGRRRIRMLLEGAHLRSDRSQSPLRLPLNAHLSSGHVQRGLDFEFGIAMVTTPTPCAVYLVQYPIY